MDNECRNIPLRQALHFFSEGNKGAEVTVFRIINIAGNDQEVGFGFDGVVHDTAQSSERCSLQLFFQSSGCITDASKRTIQMQISGMNESQWLHTFSFTASSGQNRSRGLKKSGKFVKR